ncbi:RCC1 domain-containing protein [Microbulbifer sp. A4B17]|uniref:RCC1 domain-containing protein n=1 Tax=Microbulbifer sp. A4B17 TaxID=359370 RepID=UPI001EDCAFC5|nr:RCC1 domain-containing protein [Microbulbifer sp. A4B17]
MPSDLGNVVSLDSGYYHTCSLNNLGKVNCWGDNSIAGQVDVPSDLSDVTKLHSGIHNNCAETTFGAVCWGKNDYGQSSIWYDLVDYDVGDDHVCGFNKDKVMCFGKEHNEPELLNVPSGVSGPKAIGVGRFHSCVWADTGMHCWGREGEHLIFPADLTDVTEIDASTSHTCAIDNGAVVCWGSNTNGVLNVPTNILQPHKLNTGTNHNCVLDGETTARCWGANYRNQSSDRYNLTNPVGVAAGGSFPYPHSEDDGHSCVADDYGVDCWGSSSNGVLSIPFGLTNVVDLHAGWRATCALEANGEVTCWGDSINENIVDTLNIGNVTKIEGYNGGICAENRRKLSCSGLGGALLINR